MFIPLNKDCPFLKQRVNEKKVRKTEKGGKGKPSYAATWFNVITECINISFFVFSTLISMP